MMQSPVPPAPPGFQFDPTHAFTVLVHTISTVGVVIVLMFGVRWLFNTPAGEAIAERIREGSRRRRHWKGLGGEWVDVPGESTGDPGRVAALEDQVSVLNTQVAELGERLDFAERLLAERRERKLGAGQ